MAKLYYWATLEDLKPGLRAFESQVEVKYVYRSLMGYPGPDALQVYLSALEIPDLGRVRTGEFLQDGYFHLVERTHPVSIQRLPVGRESPPISWRYDLDIGEGEMLLSWAPGGLLDGRSLHHGWIDAVMGRNSETVELYRLFSRTLTQGFQHLRDADADWLVGPDAIRRMQSGLPYHWTGDNDPRSLLDQLEQTRQARSIPAPSGPRLSALASMEYLIRTVAAEGLEDEEAPLDLEECVPFEIFQDHWRERRCCYLTLAESDIREGVYELCSLQGTDFSHSRLTENEWLDCDFREAVFCDAYIGDTFSHCDFRGANLTGADLRESGFSGCRFEGAQLKGARLLHAHREVLTLSEVQIAGVEWLSEAGFPP